MISPEKKKKKKEKENKNNKQTNKQTNKKTKGLRKEGYHHFFAAVTHFLRVLH